MRSSIRLLVVAFVALALGACGSTRQTGPEVGPAAEGTIVTVRNQSWLQMNIYVVVSGSQRIRIGTVNGNATANLTLGEHIVGIGREVSFIADPVGSSQTAQSFDLYVRRGERVTLTIPPSMR